MSPTSRRHLISLVVFVLFLMQVGIIIGFQLVSPLGTVLTDTTFDVVEIVGLAAINYALMRYLFAVITRVEESYSADLNKQLDQMLDSYRAGAQKEEELVRQLGAELSQEISLAREALAQHSVEQLDEHLQLGLAVASRAPKPLCDNIAVSAVLESKARTCETAGIRLETYVTLPEKLSIPDVEIASIFFNLIDNAIHACEDLVALGGVTPRILVQARIQANQLYIEVSNPFQREIDVNRQSALRRSTTANRHGLGTQIVETIVRQHHGISDFSQNDGVFTAAVMIPVAG